MKKINNFFSILIIAILLLNIFLPIAMGNSEIVNNEEYNETIYNNTDSEKSNEIIDNNQLIENNEISDNNEIIENEEVNDVDKDEDIETEDDIKDNNQIEENNTIENNTIENNINENNEIMLLDNEPSLGVQYKTHVQYIGWQDYVQDGKTSGTSGQSLRLEGINIQLLNAEKNLNIKYQVHIENIGWQSWKKNGEIAGTSGQSLRLEAIRICLGDSDDYSVMYRVHVQNVGWQDWKTDGEMAGTSGQSLRLEAIEIKIVPKQKKGKLYIDTPSNGSTYYSSSTINVQGWKMANTSNSSIKAYIDNTEVASSTITYYNRTDVTNAILDYGTATQNPKAGFKFSINAANLSNGNHTIKIVLYSETTALTTISSTFKVDKNLHVSYRSHVQYVGWQGYVLDGEMSGTSGNSYRVEAMNIDLINAPENAKILYRAHVQNIGWQGWKANGEMAGTSGQELRIEAIEIKLQNMDNYTVEYQVHIQDKGWSNWYIDGETAGTVGQSKRIEAIRIRIVSKYKRNYKGIDVSQFNGNINWGFVKRDNVDFAFIRVGFRGYGQAGNFAEDATFKKNIQAAKVAGIPVGVYFVTQAITDAEAVEEANWVLQKIKEYDIEYPIAIDIEAPGLEKPTDIPRTQNLDKNTRTRLAKIFCQTIQNAGYTPIIYTNVDWAVNKLNMSELAEFDTWIAHHKYDATSKPNYNGAYTIWQYSDKGSINGVLGEVDLNICYKKY